MFRATLSRSAALVFVLAVFVGGTVASAQNIAVLRFESFDAVTADVQRLVEAVQGEGSAEQLMQPLMGMMQFPGADLLDRSAPLVLVFPMQGISLGEKGLIAVVPLTDPAGAAGKLREAGDGMEPDETGVLYFNDGEGTEIAAKIHGSKLVIGQNRELVGGFDPASAKVAADLPPGNIALDIDLVPLTPMILMGLDTGRQMIQQQMSAQPTDSGMDPEMMKGMLELYFGFIQDAVNNTSRIQLSLELGEHHILMHNRWLPRAESTLEGLLKAQSGGLPDLTRYIEPGTGIASMAGQFTMTPAFKEAMNGYMKGYFEFMTALMPMMEEQADTEPIATMLASMEGVLTKWTDCYLGEFAGTFNLDDESGFQVVQVAGVKDVAVCEEIIGQMTSALDEVGSDTGKKPFVSVDRSALEYRKVLADRQVTRIPFPTGEEENETAAALLEDWFGKDGMVTYYGIAGNHMISSTGGDAEADFKNLVDKVTAKAKKQSKMIGLTAETFAPIETGPGFFISIDVNMIITRILSAFNEGEGEMAQIRSILEQIPDGAGTIVEGIRLDPDAVHLSVAMKMDLLKEIGLLAGMKETENDRECEHEHEGEDVHENEDG